MVKKLTKAVKQAVAHAHAHVHGEAETDEVPGLRERKKSRTHDAIVEAALDLFERKGYDATTVEEIAEAADISPRTFFRYFESKLDVVMPAKAQKEHEHPFEEALAAGVAEDGPAKAIHRLFRAELAAMMDQDPQFLRQFRVTMRTPSLHTKAFEHFQEHQEQLRRLFAAQLDVDEDHLQVHLRAAAVGTTVWTVVDRWVAEGAETDRLLPLLDEGFAILAAGFE